MLDTLPYELIDIILAHLSFRDWYHVGKVMHTSMFPFIRRALGFDPLQTDRLWYFSDDTYRPVHSISKMKYSDGMISIHLVVIHRLKCVERFFCIQDMMQCLYHKRPPHSKFTISLNDSMEAEFVGYLQNNDRFTVGTLVDALDQDFIWYTGRVVEETDDGFLVHFLGWTSRWDTWYPKKGGFLFPPHTFTEDWKMKIRIGDALEYRYNNRWFAARLLSIQDEHWVIETIIMVEPIHVIVPINDIDERVAPIGMHVPREGGYRENHVLWRNHDSFSWVRSEYPLFMVYNHNFHSCVLMCPDRLQYFTSNRNLKSLVYHLISDTVGFKDVPHNRKKKCRSSCSDVRRQTLISSRL